MRSVLSLVSLAVALAASTAGPAAAQSPYWNGAYAGAHAGGISVDGASFAGTPLFGSPFLTGGIAGSNAAAQTATMDFGGRTLSMAGVQVGYNWRISPALVLGVEADISDMGGGGHTQTKSARVISTPNFNTDTTWAQTGFDYFGTLRGRLGYVVAQPLLVYVTGGLAFANTNKAIVQQNVDSSFLPNTATGIFDENFKTGYTIGGGAEYAFTRHVSLKLEGLYYDLGTQRDSIAFSNFNTSNVLFTTTGVTRTQNLDGAVGRVGLNFAF